MIKLAEFVFPVLAKQTFFLYSCDIFYPQTVCSKSQICFDRCTILLFIILNVILFYLIYSQPEKVSYYKTDCF